MVMWSANKWNGSSTDNFIPWLIVSETLYQSAFLQLLLKSHFTTNNRRLDFIRVPTSSGNHGKPGKSLKKVSCMEFEKNLSNHRKIMEFVK